MYRAAAVTALKLGALTYRVVNPLRYAIFDEASAGGPLRRLHQHPDHRPAQPGPGSQSLSCSACHLWSRRRTQLELGGIESFLIVGDFALLGGAFSQSASECANHRFESFRLLDDEGPVQHGECAGDPFEAFSPQKHLQPVLTVRSIGRRRRRD